LPLVFKNIAQEGFLGPCVQWENHSWPEGRKKLDQLDLNICVHNFIIVHTEVLMEIEMLLPA
jgi:hypothetical protein